MHRFDWVRVSLLLVVCLGLSGCTSVLKREPTASADPDIAEMKRRIVELQEQAAVADVEIDRLRREMAELRVSRGAVSGSSVVGSSVGGSTVVGSRGRAIVDEAPPAVGSVPSAGTIEVSEIEAPRPIPIAVEPGRNPTSLEPPRPVDVAPAPVIAQGVPGQPVAPTVETPPAAQALYDEGYTLYHQGRYLDAEAVFQRFLGTYGALELTDNALYWIGECRYARGDFEGALASFQETVQRFPGGNKVPAALLKSGRCLESLGDFANAKVAYEQVTTQFPDDPVAGIARQRVEQIR